MSKYSSEYKVLDQDTLKGAKAKLAASRAAGLSSGALEGQAKELEKKLNKQSSFFREKKNKPPKPDSDQSKGSLTI